MINTLCFRSFIRQLIDADIVKRVDMQTQHPDLGVGRFVLTDPDIDIDLDEDVDCAEIDPLMGGRGAGASSGNSTDSASDDDEPGFLENPGKQNPGKMPKVVDLQSSGDEADGGAEAGKPRDGAPPNGANGERKELNGFPKKKKRRKDEENNFSNFVGHEIIDGEDEDDGKDAHLDELMDGLDEAQKPVVLSDSDAGSDGMPSDMDSSDDEQQVTVVQGFSEVDSSA